MAGEQNKRPSPTPSEESLSSKKAKALLASPCSPMSGVVVKKEPGEGQVGRGSLARAAAEQQVNSAVEQPQFNPTIEIRLYHCDVTGCFNRLKPPVYKCEAGHLLCDDCRRDGQCRNCNGATTFVPCPDVDRFVNGPRVPCPYEDSGCDRSVVYHEIVEHRDACAYAPCPCLVPGCHVAASPPTLREHLAADHGWTVHKFPAYAKACPLRIPTTESHRLIVRGRRRAPAVPPVPWLARRAPPDAPRQMELRVMMEADVRRCAAPGGPALGDGMWMHVMPEMLLGPSREVQLRIRIEEIRPVSASARSANNTPPGFR
ncbi:hypothetical protein EJB05_31832 [Eragrostis curvula]|uniref:RING-type E3 ubiquitin transferase n=1 Tax=Eragrostis curvula TaxID=38414 RepID=A0A5J9UG10_9POAL|nr:hypothetical protein EJB05_31832 [Eragrostis curvula]